MAEKNLSKMPTNHDGDGFIEINKRQLPAFVFTKMEIKADVKTTSKRFLRSRVEKHAARGLSYSGSMSYYHTTTALSEAIENYKNGGSFPNITVQGFAEIENVGRCEVLATGVIPKNITFLSLDDGTDDEIVHSTEFLANDVQIISKM